MSNKHDELLETIREQTRRVLAEFATPERLKSLLEVPGNFDRPLWESAIEQGWASTSVPDVSGGLGLGWRGLAVLGEELGRTSASLPLIANALAVHALLQSADSSDERIEALASGASIACLALSEPGDGGLGAGATRETGQHRLSGRKAPTAFAAVADVALVQGVGENGAGLYLVALDGSGVQRDIVPSYDNARAYARLSFEQAEAIPLGDAALIAEVTSLAALATSFEQLGGARASLALACDYARERKAFGQPIGAFQGIKHKLAEVYCAIEIAQGCVDDALDAWELLSPDRYKLTSAARIGAIKAHSQAAQENLHVHGGMGVTWEAMPHHHYRRARSLALELGGQLYWRERLLSEIGLPTVTQGERHSL